MCSRPCWITLWAIFLACATAGAQTAEPAPQPSAALQGLVYQLDGKPAANATLALATPSRIVFVVDATRVRSQANSIIVQSGPDGRYALQPPAEEWLLVVLHDSGYAEVDEAMYAKSHDVRLKPWGRIQGTLRLGANPGANRTITAASRYPRLEPDRPRVFHQIQTTTDDQGCFTLDRMPPGPWILGRKVELSENSSTSTHLTQVQVEAGRTVPVSMGGRGRPVTGRFVMPPEFADRAFSATYDRPVLQSWTPPPSPPMPENWAGMGRQARSQWYEQWRSTAAGRQYQEQRDARANTLWYTVLIASDGTFRADDVPAGSYLLTLGAGSRWDEAPHNGQAMVLVQRRFTVPDMPGGRSDTPLDLGTLQLERRQPGGNPGGAATRPAHTAP